VIPEHGGDKDRQAEVQHDLTGDHPIRMPVG
jgi:hypothetical protein